MQHPEPRGPSKIRPLTAKRPQRRGPYACDECRLRKRACDAGQPCQPCLRSRTACRYDFRKPLPRPTSRIRSLQDHLRQAREWLQQIKDELPDRPRLDLDECITSLDFSLGNCDLASSPVPRFPNNADVQSSQAQGHRDMLKGHDRVFMGEQGDTSFFGAYSDMSFVIRTIDLLDITSSSTKSNNHLHQMSNLLDRDLHPPLLMSQVEGVTYPVPDNASTLLDTVFSQVDPMLTFLQPDDLRKAVLGSQDVCIPRPQRSLLHLVLALGHLRTAQGHPKDQCRDAAQQATDQFRIGMSLGSFHVAQSLESLQGILCAINFLFSIHRIPMAHSLIGTACSLASRLGLFSLASIRSSSSPGLQKTRTRLLATVLSVDVLASLILGLPRCVCGDVVPSSCLDKLARAAEREDDLVTACTMRQCSLLAIPYSVHVHRVANNDSAHFDRSRLYRDALEASRRWREDCSSLLAKCDEVQGHSRFKRILDMMYNLSQIFLFRPHLHYLREIYTGKTVSVAESYYALACLKAASSNILLADALRGATPLPAIESWTVAYAVYSSVMCLVFLVAANPATTLPTIAWQRACKGTGILVANQCADNISWVCLEIVKMVTYALRHTLYIDFDAITALTMRTCTIPDRTPTLSHAQQGPSRELGDRQLLDFRIEPGANDKEASVKDIWDQLCIDFEMGNEADRLMEKEEVLSMMIDFETGLESSLSE